LLWQHYPEEHAVRIAFGCDHAGYEEPPPFYAPEIVAHLEAAGHTVVHCGTHGPGSVDYPDFADAVCRNVLDGSVDRGVLLCGTGMGIAIAANRHKGIRASVVATEDMARLAREHNDSNVIALGRRVLSLPQCLDYIDIWLATAFDGGERHARRIGKMG
jgi:ribose 5-phosphate isomerase B